LRSRLVKAVEKALNSEAVPTLMPPPPLPRRRAAFKIAPSVAVADQASTRTTVVEVNARDREGLLARLALAIHGQGLQVRSAHIATYGERAVDVFYLSGADGKKLRTDNIEALREALLAAAAEPERRSHAA
jgi:[protein-PII] uridylyltransferase